MGLWRGAAIVMIALVMAGCAHSGGSQSTSSGQTGSGRLSPDLAAATIDRALASVPPPTAGVTLGDGFGDPELVAFQRLGWVRVDHFAPPHQPDHVALTPAGQRAKSAGRWAALPAALGDSYLVPYGSFKFNGISGFSALPVGPDGQSSMYANFDFSLVPNDLGRALIAAHVRSVGFDAKLATRVMHGRQMFTQGANGIWAATGKPELHESDVVSGT